LGIEGIKNYKPIQKVILIVEITRHQKVRTRQLAWVFNFFQSKETRMIDSNAKRKYIHLKNVSFDSRHGKESRAQAGG